MATARPVCVFTSNDVHASPWGDPRRCVYGFNPQSAATSAMPHSGSMQQRSLLSERLHSNLKDVVVYQGNDDASSDMQDEDCFAGSDEGCDDTWSWLDAHEHTHSCVSKDSDRSSHASQPIAIPGGQQWTAAVVLLVALQPAGRISKH